MKEISMFGSDLSTMCRLCLSSGDTLYDIFSYSSKMRNIVADVIMTCSAVQITKGDGMPNFICLPCYAQLEKTHQFVTQIKNSDRTLRCHFQQLYTSDKSIKTECSAQPSENNLIFNTNKVIVKCESLELHDEIDVDFGWKENEPANSIEENEDNEEMYLKYEIKNEKMDYNLSRFLTESADDTVNASSNADGNEISGEDTKINISHVSKKSCLPSANVTENVSKCDETNKNISDYRQKHKKKNTTKSYQCGICSKCFSSQSRFYYHMRVVHTGVKPHQCGICNKCFTSLYSLKKHKRIHTGEKPYQCHICGEQFTQASTLSIHKRVHTGEKPYQCDVCGKCFSIVGDLNRHKRVHTGDKPYQCDLCGTCFTLESNLKRHKRIHTGEKPYQCDICNKRFSRASHRHTDRTI